MERLTINDTLVYPFRYKKWFARYLILSLLCFVPVLGWCAVIGYMLRVTRRWSGEEYEDYPNFSGFSELLAKGLLMLLMILLFSIPAAAFSFIPVVGQMIGIAWGLLLGIALPVFYAQFAIEGSAAAVFDFKFLFHFIQENILNLLRVFIIALLITFIIILPIASVIVSGGIFIATGEGESIWTFVGGLIILLGMLLLIIGLIYIIYVHFALAGNVYGIWQRKKTNPENQSNPV